MSICRCRPLIHIPSLPHPRRIHYTLPTQRNPPGAQRSRKKTNKGLQQSQAQPLPFSHPSQFQSASAFFPPTGPAALSHPHTTSRAQPQTTAPPLEDKALAQLLWDHARLPSALRDAQTISALKSFHVPPATLSYLMPQFLTDARNELSQLAHAPDPDLARKWNLPFVATDLLTQGEQTAVRKGLLWRFLSWAPSVVSSDPTTGPLAHLLELDRVLGSTPSQHLLSFSRGSRGKQRRIIMHVGPTNSGKTHQALQALVRARTGVYAGPLRLLAHEIWKRVNTGQIDGLARTCNLLTGEEQRWVGERASHLACTVEMTPCGTELDVVVLDEIQLLADPDRGSSWMQVLLGANAQEVHVCGEDTAVGLVQRIAEECGDVVEVRRYERLTPLKMAKQSLNGDLTKIQPGDAIVAFNRNHIFQIAKQVTEKTGHATALAYGAMPPEVRNQQARIFNDPGSSLNVLVASDAIGMGLNLKIKRVIFHRMTKWNGTEVVELSPSQAKQIAGRAGRFGLHGAGEGGEVTTLFPGDLPLLQKAMATPNPPLLRGYIAPGIHMIIEFHQLLAPGTSLPDAQVLFAEYTRCADWQLPSIGSRNTMFERGDNPLLDKFSQLPAHVQLNWMASPWPKRSIWPLVAASADDLLAAYITNPEIVQIQPVLEKHGLYDPFTVIHLGKKTIKAGQAGPAMQRLLTNPRTLVYLESAHRVVTFYLWLSYRFPVSFGEQLKAFELKNQIEDASQIVLAWTSDGQNGVDEALREEEREREKAEEDGLAQAQEREKALVKERDDVDYRTRENAILNRAAGMTAMPIPIDLDSEGRVVMLGPDGEQIPLQQRWEDSW